MSHKIHWSFGVVGFARVSNRVIASAYNGHASKLGELHAYGDKRRRVLSRVLSRHLAQGGAVLECHQGGRIKSWEVRDAYEHAWMAQHIARRVVGFGYGVALQFGQAGGAS